MSGCRRYTAVDRYALGLTLAVHCAVAVAAVRHLTLTLPAAAAAGAITSCVVVTVALAALHVLHINLAVMPVRPRWRYLSLSAQALLAVGPMPYFGLGWVGMTGLFIGTALPLCGSPARVFLLSVGVAVTTADASWHTHSAPHALAAATVTLLGALAVAPLPHLARGGARLRQAVLAATRSAEARERLLIARDLHDLLAGQLATVALKGELAGRLMGRHDDRARAELADIVRLSRDTLTDVRQLARRYRDLDLADELANAQLLLRHAGIIVRTTTAEQLPLKCEVATVLGAALREGVTNILHHSDASVCEISILRQDGGITLSLHNDGVGPPKESSPLSGSGLGNLTARATSVGGSVEATRSVDGWFRLTVKCPQTSRTAIPVPGRYGPRPDDSAPLSC
ncbi:histidine kinase [Streptomyces sp. NPDC008125]|uniref:sensor histidine kinase n=1 Tax=Streptomyces sp. NPDC008125 TaxID=3364811 RepID=UPI0036EB3A4F